VLRCLYIFGIRLKIKVIAMSKSHIISNWFFCWRQAYFEKITIFHKASAKVYRVEESNGTISFRKLFSFIFFSKLSTNSDFSTQKAFSQVLWKIVTFLKQPPSSLPCWKNEIQNFSKADGLIRFLDPESLRSSFTKNRYFLKIGLSSSRKSNWNDMTLTHSYHLNFQYNSKYVWAPQHLLGTCSAPIIIFGCWVPKLTPFGK